MIEFGTPKLVNVYDFECWENFYRLPSWLPGRLANMPIMRRAKPKLKWKDSFKNLVTTVGINKVLDAAFKSGLTSPAWYVGLKGTGTPASGDTMASHATWSEVTAYSNSNRPTWTPGSVAGGSVDNSAAKASFNINGTVSVYGAFMCTDNTIGGTAGTLYGVGDFSGVRNVNNGDTLNV